MSSDRDRTVEQADATQGADDGFSRLLTGGTFILDRPAGVPARWGDGDSVLWAREEPLLIVSPTGVGKTTLATQLVEGLVGRGDGRLLGLTIQQAEQRVLYLACDRPAQIARAMGRLFTDSDRALLDDRLVVWKGPPPADLAKNPLTLRALAREACADVVFLDSLKDVALKLSDDDIGSGVNTAIQHVIADGRDVCSLHHQRKQQQGGSRPNTLADVYGSTWLTAGTGSVVMLWGHAGDALIDLRHLKHPAAEVGPFKIAHDHNTGRSTVEEGPPDPLVVLRNSPEGLTIESLARAAKKGHDPNDAERKKAARALDRLVRDGVARKEHGRSGGDGGSSPGRYFAVGDVDSPDTAPADTTMDGPDCGAVA